MKLNSYRLNSMEEPTDEQLRELMEKVGEAVREDSRKAKLELQRRLEETARKGMLIKAKQNTLFSL